MAAVKRITRLLGVTALLACAGIAIGFVASLMRPRPKSLYAAPDHADGFGGAD